ncbi:metallophosphoesterase [Lagierella sp.]|uniref:metallophosphoesterase family protein n=1 Tax=Lagierella sp. TaxID=2849657 RepID=UPI00260208CC|nr:metallophosphoesterase [Lagierella sp.]
MKFLFFTDSHIRATNPVSRKDDYVEALKLKFNEIGEILNSYNIDYILHGGDLFDRPDVPVRTVGEFANIIRKFNTPFFIISGNHDIYGHNPKTVERSMLGLLNQIGFVSLIDFDNPIVLEEENLRIQISGIPYIYDIDSQFEKYYFPKRLENIDYHIVMIHSFLIDKPFIDSISHTLIDEIQNIDADIVLSGHYHTGFGVKRFNEKYFINPGSLARTNNSLQELKRIPEVIFLDITENELIVEEVKLKSAKKGSEIFNKNEDYSKIRNEQIENFKQLIRSSSNLENYNTLEILKEISKKQNIPKRILDDAIRRIGEVDER